MLFMVVVICLWCFNICVNLVVCVLRYIDVIKIVFVEERLKIYVINFYGVGKYKFYMRIYS